MDELLHAVIEGAAPADLLGAALPESFRAAVTLRSETDLFSDVADKDVRKSIHLDQVAMPALAPDECLVAVMASAINFNTVWSAVFEPVPTFAFLDKLGRTGPDGARHALPYHVLGSDAAGVVVRTGPAVRRWHVGDRVVVSPAYIDEQDPAAHDDGMMAGPLAWGYETNFGGLAEYCVVKATQLVPKPAHLTWEEAAANTLCAATAYRMLVGDHGARMRQGDIVLVWGATGGLGSYATQFVLNGGGIPVAVVSSPHKAALARRQGVEHVIDRSTLALGDEGLHGRRAGQVVGEAIRTLVGEDPKIVFEYLGAETFEASVFLAGRGGRIVTCGSSTGYRHTYDNRVLWMRLKSIVGSHGFNYYEAAQTNRLIALGMIHPTVSNVYALDDVAEATRAVQTNRHTGKVAVLCGAPREGLGIEDPGLRARIGEDKLNLYRP